MGCSTERKVMTLLHKRALIYTIVWSLVAAGFLYCFFSGDGPEGFVKRSPRRNIAAALIGAGILTRFLVQALGRAKKDSKRVLIDERDREISRRAAEISFFTIPVVLFLAANMLHDRFYEAGCVPVPWMFFLAYLTLVLIHLVPYAYSLVLYRSGSKDDG